MCDTIGKIGRKNRYSIFAKNSDRQYDEPQVMVFIDAKENTNKKLKATYIEIEQVKHTHAILISKPVWIWEQRCLILLRRIRSLLNENRRVQKSFKCFIFETFLSNLSYKLRTITLFFKKYMLYE